MLVMKAYTYIGVHRAKKQKLSLPVTPMEVGKELILNHGHGVRDIRIFPCLLGTKTDRSEPKAHVGATVPLCREVFTYR